MWCIYILYNTIINVEYFLGQTFAVFIIMVFKSTIEVLQASLFNYCTLNTKYLWLRQCENISVKTSMGLKLQTFISWMLNPGRLAQWIFPCLQYIKCGINTQYCTITSMNERVVCLWWVPILSIQSHAHCIQESYWLLHTIPNYYLE